MENFVVYNPVRLKFGAGTVETVGQDLAGDGRRSVLILLGQASARRSGLLDRIESQLRNEGLSWQIYEGIRPNPVYEDADRAVQMARAMQADALLPVGGGSVIDTAKAVAAGYYVGHSVWDFYAGTAPKPMKALPLYVVLTLAATGTEMNRATVLQNNATGQKRGWGNDCLFPRISYLDPLLTHSVPANYTAYGVADLMAHALEQYFSPDFSPLSDAFAIQVIREAMLWGFRAVHNGQDARARQQVLWLSTVALNGTLIAGKRRGDFGVHAVEHVLSALYDIPHGAGLSIVYPAWIRHFGSSVLPKLEALDQACRPLADEIPKLSPLQQKPIQSSAEIPFVDLLESFWEAIGTPTRLSQMNLAEHTHERILEAMLQHRATGNYFDIQETDHRHLLSLMA
jgi:alcohol dehydrogenase YqhD (iron-dependent ADH family)